MANGKRESAVYGAWKSPITSDLIVQSSIGLRNVKLDPFGEGSFFFNFEFELIVLRVG